MTREEFYLKAMISMAGNPNYVKVDEAHILQAKEIQMDAERLLKEAEDSWPEAFDSSDDNAREHLSTIANAVSELNKYGIKTYP